MTYIQHIIIIMVIEMQLLTWSLPVEGRATPFWKTKPRPVDTPTGVGVAVDVTEFGVTRDEVLLRDGICFKKEPRARLMPENLDLMWLTASLWLSEGATHTHTQKKVS